MKQKVIVLGGGVAGMSAAHELTERGFEVEVYERHHTYAGGKARSVNVPGTNLQHPDKYLPGEHGFRFFPGFYRHVTDTMRRIPFTDSTGKSNKDGCFGNLTGTSRIMIARNGKNPIVTTASFPRSLGDLKLIVHDMSGGVDSGLSKEEIHFFAEKVWQLMTTCRERRENDYERLGWWYYLEADRFSDTYRHLLVEGLTRTLVAAQARSASTKTGGDIFLQLIFNMLNPAVATDRVLNGPTNEKWLYPWLQYLREKGVHYFMGHEAAGISLQNGIIEHVTVKKSTGEVLQVTGDYYVLAVPVEKANALISPEMVAADSNLGNIARLASSVSWMNGIQYYLNEDIAINKGHIIFCDSEWALTSISQVQFWTDYRLQERYDGTVKGILSVDISDWLNTAYKGKIAAEYSPDDVAALVWEQLKAGLWMNGKPVLKDEMKVTYYLDRDIKWMGAEKHNIDKEPLLVNTINSWCLRPDAVTRIPNFFLASDYVRTNTDLATMEGANEAARRAVNGILHHAGSNAPLCQVWGLREPLFFRPLKWLDRLRYNKGLAYSLHIPLWLKVVMVPWGLLCVLITFLQVLWFKITR